MNCYYSNPPGLRFVWILRNTKWLLFFCLNLSILAASTTKMDTAKEAFFQWPVWKIEINISPQNIQHLREKSREYVRAQVKLLDEHLDDVAIHLKGIGSFRPIDDKPSFTIDLNRFVRGQSFKGLRKLHLNNSIEDSSFLREKIGTELFQSANLPAPLVTHALLELNGKPLGLYVLKEGFDDNFLSRNFKNAHGKLYDPSAFDNLEKSSAHSALDLSSDPLELQTLADAVYDPVLSRRWERLQQILNVDQFFSFMAVEIMLGHWDGYCLGKNNFRMYADPVSGKLMFLPTGMDQILSLPNLPFKPLMKGAIAHSILEIPEAQTRYFSKFEALFNELFLPATLTNRVKQWALSIQPYLPKKEFDNIWRESLELCDQIVEREKVLRISLKHPNPSLVVFSGTQAYLNNWIPAKGFSGVRIHDTFDSDGYPVLCIQTKSTASVSWQSKIQLKTGRYRFQGEASVNEIKSIPYGKHQGACLRVAGNPQRSESLIQNCAWKLLSTDFEVTLPEEEITLLCELRASAGEAKFKKKSLMLIKEQ